MMRSHASFQWPYLWEYVGGRRGIRSNLYILDVALLAVLLYGSRYWLGCMHGTVVLICSVFCGDEENRVSKIIWFMCRLEHRSPVVKWVIKYFYLHVRSCLTFCSGGRPHTSIPLGVFNSLVEPEWKCPLGRPRRRWEDNIKMDLQEMGCGGMDWIDVAQDRDRWRALVTAVMNIRALLNAECFLTTWKPASFSRRTLLHAVR